mmetsp:Transcript_48491/g.97125  ORF Transcript_48491/g.97125 Transcript_48491/m.97125 type:complete len:123 (+) Transcript_48491:42-410(+)
MREEADREVAISKQEHQAAYESGSAAIAAAKDAVSAAKRKRIDAVEAAQREIDGMKKAAEEEMKALHREIRHDQEGAGKEDAEVKARIQELNDTARFSEPKTPARTFPQITSRRRHRPWRWS